MAYLVLPDDSPTRRLYHPLLSEHGYDRSDELTFDKEIDGRPAAELKQGAAQALADEGVGEFYPHDYDADESDDPDEDADADTAESDEVDTADAEAVDTAADDDEADAANDSETDADATASDDSTDSDDTDDGGSDSEA